MKNFLICLLATVLVTGAFLSRPSEASYQKLALDNVGTLPQGSKYKDCWLWSEIEVGGKVKYAGVFSRWFVIPESTTP